MSTALKSKYDWFGVLKMSGLLVSEVIYRDYFEKTPGPTRDELFKLRRFLDRFSSESYTVNDLVKALLFDLLGHDPNKWKYGREASAYSAKEIDHDEHLTPDFVLLSEDKKTPFFIIKILDKYTELDKRKPVGAGTWRASEHIKFETLLKLKGCPLGMLTNGNEFRLFFVEEGLSAAYISWKQSDWLEEESTFEAFRNLLNANSLVSNKKKGLYNIVKESHEKQAEVTDALADQVYLVINRILDYINQSHIDVEPDKIYEAVIKVVMRLVFILYAEENSLLPHGFPEYDDNYGLIHLANSLESERAFLGDSDFESVSSYRLDAWYRILALFNLIYFGSDHRELKITAHGGDLFSPDGILPLLKRIKLNNKGVRDILNDLLYMKGLRLSYAAIDVEQIGYVYEGLLGYTVSRASEPLVVTAKEKFVLPLSELEKRSPKEIKALIKMVDSKISRVPDSFPESGDDSVQSRVARYAEILAPEAERLIPEGAYYMSSSGARKSTGSYYTPKQLTTYLVKETLGPLCTEEDTEKLKSSSEILSLKIVDPAMGSGAFLVQATNFVAEKLLKAWEIEGKHTEIPDLDREILARRNIVEHCIYGVDINPTAVELAKMSLWLNTFSKDKPFTFLDHKLKCGNSLVGVFHGWEDTSVIPPEVYKAPGNASNEWKAQLTGLKRINSQYRPTRRGSDLRRQHSMFSLTDSPDNEFARITSELAKVSHQIDVAGRETEDYFAKEQVYKEQFLRNRNYEIEKLKANVWVAQWFANEVDGVLPLTTGELQELYQGIDKNQDNRSALMEVSEHLNWTERISEEQRFFHWKLEFPDVFEAGGFDAVIGNPPWEVLKLKEREYFAGKDLEIFSNKKTNERRLLIAGLEKNNPELFRSYMKDLEQYSSTGNYISKRTLYILTSQGELNTYTLFTELGTKLRNKEGILGMVVPTGIFTDEKKSAFFRYLLKNGMIYSLVDFMNKGIFKGIGDIKRFCLLILRSSEIIFAKFNLREPEEIYNERPLKITGRDLVLVNANTSTLALFNSQRDMDLVLKIYRNSRVLLREYEDGTTDNPYGIKVSTQFHMSNDSDKFVREQELIDQGYEKNWIYYEKDNERYVPLCEGKSFFILDSRFNHVAGDIKGVPCTEKEKSDPYFFPKTRYFVNDKDIHKKYRRLSGIIAFRDITNTTNERTFVVSPMPNFAFGNTAPLLLTANTSETPLLLSLLSGHIADYVAKQKLQGTHVNFYILYQFPVPDSSKFRELPGLDTGDSCLEDSVIRRLVKCVNYSYDMEPFVKDMGYEIEPRPWNEKERLDYMAQLDAIAAQLYGIDFDDLKYIFTTFPIEKREQERDYGTYLSRDLALKYFDEYRPKLFGRE